MKKIKISKGFTVLVDDEDFDELNKYKWSAMYSKGRCYAYRQSSRKLGKRSQIWMHRFILGVVDKKVLVDHKDLNSLNNQKSNLRHATHGQNQANRSKSKGSSLFLGVTWDKASLKWRVQIKSSGKIYRIGRFDSEVDAALAYNRAAISIHGWFARLNVC